MLLNHVVIVIIIIIVIVIIKKPANVESCLADFYNHNASSFKHESRGE